MSRQTQMKTYQLKNLDCASCAARIEEGLNKLDGVQYASINFSLGTLTLDAGNLVDVKRAIDGIEPGVEISEATETQELETAAAKPNRQLIYLIISIALFLAGLLIEQLNQGSGGLLVLQILLFLSAYLISGWKVLYQAGKNIWRGRIFDENFLMSVATIGAIAINEIPEAAGVMLFYMTGEYLQNLSVERSRRSIKALIEVRPDKANVLVNKEIVVTDPKRVAVGSTIVINPGERVPLDCVVQNGEGTIDTSVLTGESMPMFVQPGASILAGMVNQNGMLTGIVTRSFDESSIARIMNLVESAAARKAATERFITTFAKYYSPVVVLGALLVAVVPPLTIPGAQFQEWLYRALVVLVISCPCALVVSIPLGYFGGVGGASRKGILVKGSNFLDVLAAVKVAVFDKTGTLTQGRLEVTEIHPSPGISSDQLLVIAARAEAHSNHPIAQSIRNAAPEQQNGQLLAEFVELPGLGVRAMIDGKQVLVGQGVLMDREGVARVESPASGTTIHVAVDRQYWGYLQVSDRVKHESREALDDLRKAGVERVIMLTGDQPEAARQAAEQIGEIEIHAGLLPEDKVRILEEVLQQSKGKVAFIGDGINDAPVLARADVGIAMGAIGSDAAIDTADVVLMTDSPKKVAEAIRIGKQTRAIVWQNIVIALAVKLFFIVVGISGGATMWEAVFADMGVALLAILNASRIYHMR